MTILKELVDLMSLLREDRESLKARGFDDSVINNYAFRSCGPINSFILSALQEKYGIERLVEESLYEADPNHAGVFIPQRQLLSPKILIPYLESGGGITKVRPHKLGFAGQGSLVFRTDSSYRGSHSCIIAESEFKAVAAECFGYSAVGIPGITSMSGQNWDYFESVLKGINTKEFIICFDNEVKDNPAYKNFKADWRARYETIIYAYAMAVRIIQAGLKCRVATLPADWMVDGKIDIDTALAQGRTRDHFREVVEGAQAPDKYLERAPIQPNHRGFVGRRLRRYFFVPKVEVRSNCFFSKGVADADGVVSGAEKLSNFIITIQNVYEEIGGEVDGVMRDIVITDEYGMSPRPIPIVAGSMSSKAKFKEWLMSKGNFLYYGGEAELTAIWEYVFNNDDGNVVYLVNRCGYIKEFDFHMFANVLIKGGKAVYPDDNGIFWVENIGFKPNSIHEDVSFPKLQTKGTFDMAKFTDMVGKTVDFDGPGMGKALIAWMLSVIFIEDVQRAFKLFPIMFLYGQRSSGKTTVMRWLNSFFGQETATLSLSASSSVGVTRGLGYYSGLPFVVDDWRNDQKMRGFIPLFLGVYNRQSGVKGVKTKFGLQVTSVRAALVIMGEELLPDNALLSRCLSFYMPMYRVEECSEYVEEMLPQASKFIFDFFTTKYEAAKKTIVRKISDKVKKFKADYQGLDSRIAINYAIILASYETVIGEDKQLSDYIARMMSVGHGMMIEGDKLHQFAEELMCVAYNHDVDNGMFFFDGDDVHLWMKGLCDAINKYYNRHNDNTAGLLIQHFQRQEYFVGLAVGQLKHGGPSLPLLTLRMSLMPKSLQTLFNSVKGVLK